MKKPTRSNIVLSTFSSSFEDYHLSLDSDKMDYTSESQNIKYIATPPFIKPHISITSFDTRDMVTDSVDVEKATEKLKSFFGEEVVIMPRAIYCIKVLIEYLSLKKEDNIAIYKTFDNHYISRCVTDTISSYCKWTRRMNNKTKAVMIIHEFGYPYKKIHELKKICRKKGVPLIENCAWVYGSYIDKKNKVGDIGDFVIYSLPKILPVQYGGILKGLKPDEKLIGLIDSRKRKLILAGLLKYIDKIHSYNQRRRRNWEYLATKFDTIKLTAFTKPAENVFPAVFLLKTDEYQDLHRRCLEYGIETGRYYHENALYIPIHQKLNKAALNYIFSVIKGYFFIGKDK